MFTLFSSPDLWVKGRAEAVGSVNTRRSCRCFSELPVEREKVNQVVEVGRFAPSGGNSQSAHFIVVTNQKVLSELRDMVQDEFSKMEIQDGMYRSMVNSIALSKKGTHVFHYAPPVFIIVTNKKGYGNAMVDSSCAMQNMMLMANELGLGSCWINQLHWLDENPRIKAYLKGLGVADDETVCASLSLGYATELNRNKMERRGNPVTYID